MVEWSKAASSSIFIIMSRLHAYNQRVGLRTKSIHRFAVHRQPRFNQPHNWTRSSFGPPKRWSWLTAFPTSHAVVRVGQTGELMKRTQMRLQNCVNTPSRWSVFGFCFKNIINTGVNWQAIRLMDLIGTRQCKKVADMLFTGIIFGYSSDSVGSNLSTAVSPTH
jgi:hypothetical protein